MLALDLAVEGRKRQPALAEHWTVADGPRKRFQVACTQVQRQVVKESACTSVIRTLRWARSDLSLMDPIPRLRRKSVWTLVRILAQALTQILTQVPARMQLRAQRSHPRATPTYKLYHPDRKARGSGKRFHLVHNLFMSICTSRMKDIEF
jgi:hypothetical protein